MKKLEDLLKTFLKNGLKISQNKCQLFRKELQYIGNTIFIQEKRVCIKPLHSTLEAIQKLRPPTTVNGCRSFVGMVNFLSIFFQDLQKHFKPISGLTRKYRPFNWGQEQQHLKKLRVDYKNHQYYIYLMAKGDSICIQILVNIPWAVLYIRYKMESLN